jgi:hypothetical protein
MQRNSVTVEQCHGSGSTTVIDCGGAMSIGEEALGRSKRWVKAKRRAVLWSGSKEQRTTDAKC